MRVRFGDDGRRPLYSYANQRLARMSKSAKDQNAKALEEARDDAESGPSGTACRHWNVGMSRQNCSNPRIACFNPRDS